MKTITKITSIIFLFAASVLAVNQTVTTTNDTGVGSLRQAVADVGAGENITFNFASYPATITISAANGDIDITKSMNIIGRANPRDIVINGDRQDRPLDCYPNGGIVSISGLTISNGYTDSARDGAAIWIGDDGTRLTVSNCILTHCESTDCAGAIYVNDAATNKFIDCVFEKNIADEGGAVYVYDIDADDTFINCVFDDNHANYDDGGALYLNGYNTLKECSLINNKANWRGGAIYVEHPGADRWLHLYNCTFATNSVTSGGSYLTGGACHFWSNQKLDIVIDDCTFVSNSCPDDGGAFYTQNTYFEQLYITNTTFHNNYAGDLGGAIRNRGNLTLYGCTLSDNHALDDGGGLYSYDGTNYLVNCTVSGNRSDDLGGGIYIADAFLDMYNCTVATNIGDGGGLRINDSSPGTVNLYSSIFADNSDNDLEGPISSLDHCLYETASGIGTPSGGDNISGIDPMLQPLADNGGLTLTHNLTNNSAAIRMGTNILNLVYDQRGAARVNFKIDIGSVEWIPEPCSYLLFIILCLAWQFVADPTL